MSAKDVRRAVVLLASYTGWSLSELLELEDIELMAWLEALPKEGNG